ncbi:hypothetical protein DPEC_G00249520, partial [Dallia pectoralis]
MCSDLCRLEGIRGAYDPPTAGSGTKLVVGATVSKRSLVPKLIELGSIPEKGQVNCPQRTLNCWRQFEIYIYIYILVVLLQNKYYVCFA